MPLEVGYINRFDSRSIRNAIAACGVWGAAPSMGSRGCGSSVDRFRVAAGQAARRSTSRARSTSRTTASCASALLLACPRAKAAWRISRLWVSSAQISSQRRCIACQRPARRSWASTVTAARTRRLALGNSLARLEERNGEVLEEVGEALIAPLHRLPPGKRNCGAWRLIRARTRG